MSVGITPARAGKTEPRSKIDRDIQDHPRSCGKDIDIIDDKDDKLGSPPLVRERLKNTEIPIPSRGITPARAGETD